MLRDKEASHTEEVTALKQALSQAHEHIETIAGCGHGNKDKSVEDGRANPGDDFDGISWSRKDDAVESYSHRPDAWNEGTNTVSPACTRARARRSAYVQKLKNLTRVSTHKCSLR